MYRLETEYRRTIYEVRAGDTLSKIARKFDVTEAMISRENPDLDIYDLQPKDLIFLPIKVRESISIIEYTVEPGDCLHQILNKYQLDLDDLLSYNNLTTMKLNPGDILRIPRKDYIDRKR